MTLTLNASTVLQVLAWLVAFLAAIDEVIPAKYRTVAFVVSTGASLLLHQLAGRKNPDGTSARVAWEPAPKKLKAVK